MVTRLLGCLFLAASIASGTAQAQSREKLAEAARAFDESALRSNDDNTKPMPVRKWMTPIRLAFANPGAAPGLVDIAGRGIKTIAAEAGVVVIDVAANDSTANFVVQFDENGLNGKSGYCFGSAWWDKSKVIYRGELRLNPTRIKDFDRCAIHEPMHSFGFLSHPHAAPSVLSYVNKAQRTLTPLDSDLIHTLYDPRLTAGMVPAAASQLACRILAERMKSAGPDIEAVCRNRQGPSLAN